MTTYTKTTWVNGQAPAINDSNLNKIETGIETSHTELQSHLDDTEAAHAGTAISNTPAGNIIATTTQAAINELDSEKVPITTTVNSKALSSNITLGLASADFANQGTTTTLLHGNAAGNPGFGAVVTNDITDANITYAKIQNVSATDKILGRSTAGAGSVEEIACTSVGRALIDDATVGDQRTTLGLVAGGTGDIWVEKAGDTMTGDLTLQNGVEILETGLFDFDLTAFTETDPSGAITVNNKYKATFTNIPNNAYNHLKRDNGSANINDFIVRFDFTITADNDGTGSYNLISINDDNANNNGFVGTNSVGLVYTPSGNLVSIYKVVASAYTLLDVTAAITIGTTYYCTFYRVGTTLTCEIYTDAERKTLFDTITGTASSTAFRYIAILYTYNNASSTMSGNFHLHEMLSNHTISTGTSVHGLGSMSTQSASSVAITGGTVVGINYPKINRIAGITPTIPSVWNVDPTNLTNITDYNFSNFTGTGTVAASGDAKDIEFDALAAYTVTQIVVKLSTYSSTGNVRLWVGTSTPTYTGGIPNNMTEITGAGTYITTTTDRVFILASVSIRYIVLSFPSTAGTSTFAVQYMTVE